jgi:hypothetical protein
MGNYLVDELKSNDKWVVEWKEIDGGLQSLFFASQDQVELMRSWILYILIDATYKSNRHNMCQITHTATYQ